MNRPITIITLFFLFLFPIILVTANDGDLLWEKTYPNGRESNVSIDSYDNIIIANLTSSDDMSIIKYTQNGDLDWQNYYDLTYPIYYATMTVDKNDKIIVVGSYYDGACNKLAIVKYNSRGMIEWENHILGTNPVKISLDSKNNLILATAIDGDVILSKFSPLGSLIFEKRYDEEICHSYPIIQIDKLDNIVMSMQTSTNTESYLTITKNDTFGNLLWKRYYSLENSYLSQLHLFIDDDNNIILGGLPFAASDFLLIIKYSPNGILLLDKKYSWNNGLWGNPNSLLTIDSKKNLIATISGQSMKIIKFSKTGEIIWDRDYNYGNPSWGASICIDSYDNLFLSLNHPCQSNNKKIVCKLNSDGNIIWENGPYEDDFSWMGEMALDSKNNLVVVNTTYPHNTILRKFEGLPPRTENNLPISSIMNIINKNNE